MPCSECGKKTGGKSVNSNPPRLMHPILDRMELMLQQAWISEIKPEQRELVTQFIHAIQALKNPYMVPLEAQLLNYLEAGYMVGSAIPCGKCGKAWVWGVAKKVLVRVKLERGDVWGAFKLYVESDLKEKWWLLSAIKDKIL